MSPVDAVTYLVVVPGLGVLVLWLARRAGPPTPAGPQCPRCAARLYPRANFCQQCGHQHASDYELRVWWEGRRLLKTAKREATNAQP
jgi:predicted amidophosphoribosyltransferase